MGNGASSSASSCSSSCSSPYFREDRGDRARQRMKGRDKFITPGPVRSLDIRLYNEFGINATSRVRFPHLKSKKLIPELQQVRTQVMYMANNVDQLLTESDSIRERILDMKKKIRNVDFGLGVCKRAQEETVKKMLSHQKSKQKKRVQVNPKDKEFESFRQEKAMQTLSMDELMVVCMTAAITDKDNENLQNLAQSLTHLDPYGDSSICLYNDDSSVPSLTDISLIKTLRKENALIKSDPEEQEKSEKSKKKSRRWITTHSGRERFVGRIKERLSKIRSKPGIAFIVVLASMLMYSGTAVHFLHLSKMKDVVSALKEETIHLMNTTQVICPPLTPPVNGFIKCNSDKCEESGECLSGGICSFYCDDWHRIGSSSNDSVCSASGTWSTQAPTCTHMRCSQVQDRDCASLISSGSVPREDGIHTVVQCRTFEKFDVFCDFSTMGGGWTAIQERISGKINFQKDYKKFEKYFGAPGKGYWIGLEAIHLLTVTTPQQLLVQMTDWAYPIHQRLSVVALYKTFRVESPATGYRLKISDYEREVLESQVEAGDSMTTSEGMQFTTFDSDRDLNEASNCAKLSGAAWWHRNCTDANLNAKFASRPTYGKKSMYWNTWRVKASVKEVRMLIRPKDWS